MHLHIYCVTPITLSANMAKSNLPHKMQWKFIHLVIGIKQQQMQNVEDFVWLILIANYEQSNGYFLECPPISKNILKHRHGNKYVEKKNKKWHGINHVPINNHFVIYAYSKSKIELYIISYEEKTKSHRAIKTNLFKWPHMKLSISRGLTNYENSLGIFTTDVLFILISTSVRKARFASPHAYLFVGSQWFFPSSNLQELGLMLWSHQTFRLVVAVKLLGDYVHN